MSAHDDMMRDLEDYHKRAAEVRAAREEALANGIDPDAEPLPSPIPAQIREERETYPNGIGLYITLAAAFIIASIGAVGLAVYITHKLGE